MKQKIANIGTEAINYIQDAESTLESKTGTKIVLVAYENDLNG